MCVLMEVYISGRPEGKMCLVIQELWLLVSVVTLNINKTGIFAIQFYFYFYFIMLMMITAHFSTVESGSYFD